MKKLIIAGGGTGGHIFPGIAVAQEWQKQHGEVLFVGTPIGQEKDRIPAQGFRIAFLKVGQLKGAGVWKKIKTLSSLPLAFLSAKKILKKERPDVVLGIGGYSSGPTCLVARFCGIKTAILDQNVYPGITNRILAKFVHQIFVSFEKTKEFFPSKKILVTGNPIRTQFAPYPYHLPKQKITIFVFGGSQGAVTLNQVFIQALLLIKKAADKITIIHQAGTDKSTLEEFYKRHQFKAIVKEFFVDIEKQYEAAHLVIARAGAGTVTELAVCGRPCLLVPYPFAADDHQKKKRRIFCGERWRVDD